jgi:hypothetical protein
MAARRRDALTLASVAFVVANVAHGLDHQRQGTGRLTTEVLAGGTVLTLLAFGTLALVLRRHPRAPLVAAAVGLWSAVAVAAAHIAPHWSAFSDPYPDLSVDALSWAVMLAEVASAFVLGVVGVRALRREGARRPAPASG